MSPRRMDGFARPAGPAPVRPQPAPAPAQRPMAPAPRMAPLAPRPAPRVAPVQPAAPVRPVAQRPVAAVPSAPRREKPAQAVAGPRKSGGWKVVLQFVVGLLVIAAVAGTIVWLYVKYYAQ